MTRSLREVVRTVLTGTVDLILPASCWMCGARVTDRRIALCESCENRLAQDEGPMCAKCGSSLSSLAAAAGVCPHCHQEDFAFEGVVRLGAYRGLLREAILRMKRNEAFAEVLAEFAARHLLPRLYGRKYDVVISVPLHWKRRLWRGYNQSEVLARALAELLEVPLSCRALSRHRATPFQTHLKDHHERRRNVRGAFEPSRLPELKGRTVLLIDDVMTSGATVHEAARVLRKSGTRTVVVCVLAHGGSPTASEPLTR